ncbi:hypothetical protein JK358_35740 [Nocardia sp. 2]|uniref:DUF4226 domain-containing protein n=1 Tax=Nocardia acididurans TaxID=2802282 RepID=A0ABS1MGG8_9NOCA|nr:hypothetical protein [Nocardia acididurans]MBL1079768.1 hypothetical protein [Nocardia acididurans]
MTSTTARNDQNSVFQPATVRMIADAEQVCRQLIDLCRYTRPPTPIDAPRRLPRHVADTSTMNGALIDAYTLAVDQVQRQSDRFVAHKGELQWAITQAQRIQTTTLESVETTTADMRASLRDFATRATYRTDDAIGEKHRELAPDSERAVQKLLNDTVATVENTVRAATKAITDLAADLSDPDPRSSADSGSKNRRDSTPRQPANSREPGDHPTYTPPPTQSPGPEPYVLDDYPDLQGTLLDDGGQTTGLSAQTSTDPRLSALFAQLRTDLAALSTPATSTGSGMNMQDMMTYQMLANAMGTTADRDTPRSTRRDRDTEEIGSDEPSAPATAQTTTEQPAPAQVTATGDTPPATGPEPDAPTTTPLLIPGFEQDVPPTVAQAAQREWNNHGGSDAVNAYRGTAWGNTENWTQIGEAELRTGDVVEWEHRTNLVIMKDGVAHMMSGQNIVPINLAAPYDDGHGAYGNYQRYLRPSGAEATQPAATGGNAAPVQV